MSKKKTSEIDVQDHVFTSLKPISKQKNETSYWTIKNTIRENENTF
jgi:hypothetical protein